MNHHATPDDVNRLIDALPTSQRHEWRIIATRQYHSPAARQQLDTLHGVIYSLITGDTTL